MRVVHGYLVVYFVLLFSAVFVLWQAEVLSRLPATWVAGVIGIALALGVLLALVSRRPRVHD